MEKLNQYLQTLLSSCGYELRLEPNKTPYVVVDDGVRNVANVPLLGTQISMLVFPLIPAAVKARLPHKTEVEFVHRHALGKFNFHVKKSPAGFDVTIRPMLLPQPDDSSGASRNLPEIFGDAAFLNSESEVLESGAPTIAAFSNTVTHEEFAFPDAADFFENEFSALEIEEMQANYAEHIFEDELPEANFEPEITAGDLNYELQKIVSEYAPQSPNLSPSQFTEEIKTSPSVAAPIDATPKAEKQFDRLFYKMAELGASRLYLSSGAPPMIRCKDGRMRRLEDGAATLSPETVKQFLESIMPAGKREEFAARRNVDFAYEIEPLARFRADVFTDRKGMGAVFRRAATHILTAEEVGISKAVTDLCRLESGLIVVAGAGGSGKSMTLCAMIDLINKTREAHIITIEDRIEMTHENLKCLVSQREAFSRAGSLRDVLREEPDVVCIDEMHDSETILTAIEAAETDCLVFGTLPNAANAAAAVDTIIDRFPAERRTRVREMLSASLKAVIAPTLLPKKGGGRAAALEVLIVTPAISNLIREGKTAQITPLMRTEKANGTVMLDDELMNLAQKGIVEPPEAYGKAVDKPNFESLLTENGLKI